MPNHFQTSWTRKILRHKSLEWYQKAPRFPLLRSNIKSNSLLSKPHRRILHATSKPFFHATKKKTKKFQQIRLYRAALIDKRPRLLQSTALDAPKRFIQNSRGDKNSREEQFFPFLQNVLILKISFGEFCVVFLEEVNLR